MHVDSAHADYPITRRGKPHINHNNGTCCALYNPVTKPITPPDIWSHLPFEGVLKHPSFFAHFLPALLPICSQHDFFAN